MIILPAKFEEYNKKSESTPATIVKLGDSLLEDIQGTSADWQNNSSETQVDYTTIPGSVIIESDTLPAQSQGSNDANLVIYHYAYPSPTVKNDAWQSFRQSTDAVIQVNKINFNIFAILSGSATLGCTLYNAKLGGAISPEIVESVPGGAGNIEFDFSGENVNIQNHTVYWIKLRIVKKNGYIVLRYNSAGGYADGQLDAIGDNTATDIGDAQFSVSFQGDYYLTSGNIRTQNIDLGETPAVNGEWKFNATEPNQYGTTAVVYTCFGSTDNFSASNVSIGAKIDGDSIESGDWYRYYRITSSLSTTSKNEAPSIQDVGVSFVEYIGYSDYPIFGYEQSLDGVSSLSTKIDDFDLATVSQITCNIGFTETISDYFYSNFPKNKPAKVLIGFVDADFYESDFYELYVGAIDKWKITPGHMVNITVKDVSKSWGVDVPKEITTGDGNQTAGTYQALNISADHPVDAMLEILQNHLDIRDAVIDTGSFAAVKADLTGWVVTQNLTGEREKADDLLNQLRILTSTYFLPDATGKIKLKAWDSAEAAVETLTDDDFLSPLSWDSNIEKLYNKVFLEFDWDTGTETFDHVYIAIDATSITNNDETSSYDFEDKWTLNAQVAQIQAVKTFILDRYKAPPAKITGTMDRKKMYLEVGDMINLTTTQAPSSDLSGITADKYQIIEKNFDQNRGTIKFVFLEV